MNIFRSLMVDLYVYVVSSWLIFFQSIYEYIFYRNYGIPWLYYLFVRARRCNFILYIKKCVHIHIKKDSVICIYAAKEIGDIMIGRIYYARKEWHISLANDHHRHRHRHYPYCLNECCCCCCHQKDYRSFSLHIVCHRFLSLSPSLALSMCIHDC